MVKQDATYLLKETILRKEAECEAQYVLLKAQLEMTMENLKPLHLIKEVLTSSETKNSIMDTAIGLTSGFLVKKAVVRSSKNPFLSLLGTIIGMGAANLVSNNAGGIKFIGGKILNTVFKKNENTQE